MAETAHQRSWFALARKPMSELGVYYISGAFGGICVLVMVLSLLIGYAYDERMLWWHAGALAAAWPAQHFQAGQAPLAMIFWALQLVLAAQTLIAAVGTAGGMHKPARALRLMSLLIAALLGSHLLAELDMAWFAMPWAAATGWFMYRSWNQSRPWIYWMALGQAALLAYWLLAASGMESRHVTAMAALAVFAIASYLAMVWKSRLHSENSLRIEARERTDPLTGLSMPRIFSDRVDGALIRSRNLGYTSALMLIRVVNLEDVVAEQGMENSEAVVLGASHAIASTLRAQDCAARLASNRFGVLAEGVARGEVNELATRILARGLRGEEWGLRGSRLEFDIAVMEVGPVDMKANTILFDLEESLTSMREQDTTHHIRTVHPGLVPQAA